MFGPPTEILPFLYLGSNYNAVHRETIQQDGISHILNVADECEVNMKGATYKKNCSGGHGGGSGSYDVAAMLRIY
jgi:hypothetical protein